MMFQINQPNLYSYLYSNDNTKSLQVEMVQGFGQEAPWTSLWGGVWDMPIQEETQRQTKDMLERSYRSIGLGTS